MGLQLGHGDPTCYVLLLGESGETTDFRFFVELGTCLWEIARFTERSDLLRSIRPQSQRFHVSHGWFSIDDHDFINPREQKTSFEKLDQGGTCTCKKEKRRNCRKKL